MRLTYFCKGDNQTLILFKLAMSLVSGTHSPGLGTVNKTAKGFKRLSNINKKCFIGHYSSSPILSINLRNTSKRYISQLRLSKPSLIAFSMSPSDLTAAEPAGLRLFLTDSISSLSSAAGVCQSTSSKSASKSHTSNFPQTDDRSVASNASASTPSSVAPSRNPASFSPLTTSTPPPSPAPSPSQISTRGRLIPIPAALNEFRHLPFFSQYPLDRKVEWRRNQEALKLALENPQSRLILTYRHDILVQPYISPLVGKKGSLTADKGDFFYPEESQESISTISKATDSDTKGDATLSSAKSTNSHVKDPGNSNSSSSNHGLLQPVYLRPASKFLTALAAEDTPLIFLGVDRNGVPYFAAEASEDTRRVHDAVSKSRKLSAGVGGKAPAEDRCKGEASSVSWVDQALPFNAEWKAARNAGPRMLPWDGSLTGATSSLMIWHRDNRFCGANGEPFHSSSGGYVRVTSPLPDGSSIPSTSTTSSSLGAVTTAPSLPSSSSPPSSSFSVPPSLSPPSPPPPVSAVSNPVSSTKSRRYVEYPRIDPAVIMLVAYGDYALLGRKKEWPPGRYSTLAGFLEVGEALEMAVVRETMEESGIDVDVKSVAYFSSQPWPFPRSLMIGFTAKAKTVEGGVEGVKAMLRKALQARREREGATGKKEGSNNSENGDRSAVSVIDANAVENCGRKEGSCGGTRNDNRDNDSSNNSASNINAENNCSDSQGDISKDNNQGSIDCNTSASDWWPISSVGKAAVKLQGIRREEVEAALLPALMLPPPVPCPEEMEDVRWFHVGTMGASVLKHLVSPSNGSNSTGDVTSHSSGGGDNNTITATTTTTTTTPPPSPPPPSPSSPCTITNLDSKDDSSLAPSTYPALANLAYAAIADGQRSVVGEPSFHVPGQYALSHNLIFYWLAQHGLCMPGSGIQEGFGSAAAQHTARATTTAPAPAMKDSCFCEDGSSLTAAAYWLWRRGFPQVCLDTEGEYKYVLLRVSLTPEEAASSSALSSSSVSTPLSPSSLFASLSSSSSSSSSSPREKTSSLAVWGARSCAYHSDILAAATAFAKPLGLIVEPLGGGFVKHQVAYSGEKIGASDEKNNGGGRARKEESNNAVEGGVLTLYGESGGFGPAPHEVAAALIRKWNPQLDLVPAARVASAVLKDTTRRVGDGVQVGENKEGGEQSKVPPAVAALNEDGSVVLKYWASSAFL